jgi:CMP-N,N'-diacetyllegionaminic acid synthase
MKRLAIIPARSGSKGLPGKNLRNLAGKPLIAWTIEQALESKCFDVVHVSTDCLKIAEIARSYGADVPYLRPTELASDVASTEPVILYAVNWYERVGLNFDVLVLLQPTSPIRLPGTINAALGAFDTLKPVSLLGVCESHSFFWKLSERPVPLYDFKNRPRRQDIKAEERWYRENGSIYITRTREFKKYLNRLCEPVNIHIMHEVEGWEIDSLSDFLVIEALIKHLYIS